MKETLKWIGLTDATSEVCTIETSPLGISIASDITGSVKEVPVAIHYRVELDKNWLVQSFAAENNRNEFSFGAHQSSPGKWFDKDNKPLTEFDGCIDIDLFPTPLTNSLPVKRETFQPGESKTFRMLWIDLTDGIVRVDRQRYTYLHHSVFKFDSLDTDFSTEIVFNNELYVKHYPALFRLV